MQLIKDLISKKKISPPDWLVDNILFAVKHGSHLYGNNTENSDVDIYGVCMPPREFLFPHEAGWINGFGQPPSFEVWTQHHIDQYDFNIFGLPRFFHLLIGGNLNIVECLFAPTDCVLYTTPIFQKVLCNRHLFLSKRVVPKYCGYLKSQLHAANRNFTGNRKTIAEKFGYDTKFMSHAVRLGLNCEQLLDGDLDLRRDKDLIRDVRLGKFSFSEMQDFVLNSVKRIAEKLPDSTIPDDIDREAVKNLLNELITIYYQKGAYNVYCNGTGMEL